MRRGVKMSLPIFFAAVLALYIAVNAYLLARIFATLAGAARFLAALSLLFLSLAFPAGQILSRTSPGRFSEALVFAGSLYLAPMIYAFLLTAVADIFRLLNFTVKLTPSPLRRGTRAGIVAAVALLSAFISLAGHINATMPAARYLSLDFSAAEADGSDIPESIRIVAISDIHLGRLVTNRHLKRLVDLTNRQKPDIVLLVGDTIDDLGWMNDPAARAETASLFRSLKADMGIWAVPGNHDYYVGVERVAQLMGEAGVTLLRDGWAAPRERLLLLGRDDRTLERMSGEKRRPLPEIRDEAANALGEKFARLPLIVLDHQPTAMEESRDAGATLQLSGHTHGGQLFPINFIVARFYKKLCGAYKDGGTNYYISSGAGTWGPPVRTSGRPEIVVIDLQARR